MTAAPLDVTSEPVAEAPPAAAVDELAVYVLSAGGWRLALPAAAVVEVMAMPADAEAAPGHIAIGLVIHDEFPLWLADLAAVVLPSTRFAALAPGATRLTHAVRLRGSAWALAVEAKPQALMLSPGEIQVRGRRGTRPWLAGTVRARGLALLDVSALAALLAALD